MKHLTQDGLLTAVLALLGFSETAQAEEGSAGHYAASSFASFVDVLPASRAWAPQLFYTGCLDCGFEKSFLERKAR